MSGYVKGWCPTLQKPMESGDGLLVRLNISDGRIAAETARKVAQLSVHYGNGQMDLTSRGNLQIRGVHMENYAALFQALSQLGFREEERKARVPAQPLPELGYDGDTLALGLLFGRIDAQALTWLAQASPEATIGLSPWRTVYIHNAADGLLEEAQAMGFITRTDDARRFIEACPGAPACSSAEGDTRALALSIAGAIPELGSKLHVSGCAKGCACSAQTAVVVTARDGLYDMAFDNIAGTLPAYVALTQEKVIEKMLEWKETA